MSDTPERIWVDFNTPGRKERLRFVSTGGMTYDTDTEYIRADFMAAQLDKANETIAALKRNAATVQAE